MIITKNRVNIDIVPWVDFDFNLFQPVSGVSFFRLDYVNNEYVQTFDEWQDSFID